MTSSSTGGYLSPLVLSPPEEDSVLDTIFQKAIVGITSLPGDMVRPRWQAIEPKQPDPSVNWAAFSINETKPDANAAITQDSSGETATYQRHTEIEILVTFYGPNRNFLAELLRDGLAMPQNIEALKINLINYLKTGIIVSIPELVNQQWIRRSDIRIHFRRKIQRQYAIENLVELGSSEILADPSNDQIIVVPLNVNNQE